METATAGTQNKRDCTVDVSQAASLKIEVDASNKPLVERGIAEVARAVCEELGLGKATIRVVDRGALDYVIAGRVEAALRTAFPKTFPIRPEVTRKATAQHRLRRTRLYVPGNNARLLLGVELHDADCVILDLEDSVPPSEKPTARILIKHLLASIDLREAWVRINPLTSYGMDDLREVLLGHPHGICLPKAETAGEVEKLSQELANLEGEYGIPQGSVHIMPIIETAAGVLHCEEIARTDERITTLSFGAEDLTRDIAAKRTDDSLLFARSMVVAGAKASHVQASDTIYPNVEDEEGLIAETKLIASLGFDGKGAINPRQIAPIHSVFAPSEDELEEAKRIVAAAEEADRQGVGATTVGGKMIDKPVLERARRTIQLAELMDRSGEW